MATDWVHIDDAWEIANEIRREKDQMIEAQREMIKCLEETIEFWRTRYETAVASQLEETDQ